jgi:transposase
LESIRKLVKKLEPASQLQACYEAGPTGYVLYWQLAALGVKCQVVAPSLVPTKAGDRVKTDRRDAEKLARSHRSGDLTAVWGARWLIRETVACMKGADNLLTSAETAARLGIRPRTLIVWRQRAIGPAYVRSGGVIRYRECDVEAYLRKQTVPEGRAPKAPLWPIRRWWD